MTTCEIYAEALACWIDEVICRLHHADVASARERVDLLARDLQTLAAGASHDDSQKHVTSGGLTVSLNALKREVARGRSALASGGRDEALVAFERAQSIISGLASPFRIPHL